MIISGGENVSSIEVEDALFSHEAVAEVAVIGVPDEKWGETVKALVVLAPAAAASEADLIEHCRSRLAHYKCPTSVEFREGLAHTATGKLQKYRLREPYWAGPGAPHQLICFMPWYTWALDALPIWREWHLDGRQISERNNHV